MQKMNWESSTCFFRSGEMCALLADTPDGSAWAVGIQNPDVESDQAYIKKVEVQDLSVVTSGNYQRYYTVDGKDTVTLSIRIP